MRNKQIEKVSQRLFIVTSVLAVSLLLLSALVYPDLPAHVPSGPVWLEYLSTKLSISTTIW